MPRAAREHSANNDSLRVPTCEKLARELRLVHAPDSMVRGARRGVYDQYASVLDAPLHLLYDHCLANGLADLADRVLGGEFEPQAWEAEAWARTNPQSAEHTRWMLSVVAPEGACPSTA